MPVTPLRLPVRLAGAPGVGYHREPLTFGVPFAAGACPAGTALRAVTADGRALPLQTAVMTTWQNDLRHVKWLLADLQADPATDGETVWLETPAAAAAPAPAPAPAITLTERDGLLTVDTGALRLRLRTYSAFEIWRHRECDSPIAGCAVKTADGWREVLHGAGLLLYMRDQHGHEYTSLAAWPPPRVVVEERGPLRVAVLLTGHLWSATGVRFCPYRLRLHLYAGKADLRLGHTFIFDQDPTRVELSAIGLKVLLRPGDQAVAAVGGAGAAAHRYRTWRELALLQADDQNYTARLDGAPCGAGAQAAGWAALSGTDAGVVAAVRDFWQEYPKGFTVSRDALELGIWPADAPQPLSFLTPFREPPIYFNGTRDEAEVKRLLAERPTAPLMLKSFHLKTLDDVRWVEDVIERLAPGRVKSYCDFMGVSTGLGAAKTTELVLRFAAGPVADAAATAFAATVQEPLAAIVAPDYLCGTEVFGRFLPAGLPQFAELDRYCTELFEQSMIGPLERCRRYGMFLHGHMVNGHTMLGGPPSSDLVYHFYKNSAPEKALRYVGPFNNEAMDLALGVWGQFLRTGARRYLRQAQLTARAIGDVSFVHAFPGHEENVGCIHYHGAHAWSNTLNRSHSEIGAIVADYYLTGNRRSYELALEAAECLLYDKLEPCGIVNSFSRLYREFTGPLAILIEAYQLTWHEKYGEPARRSLAWLLRTVRTPGHLPGSVYTRGPRGTEAVVEPEFPPGAGACNPYHVFDPALRLFPSQTLRDFVLAQANYALRHGGTAGLTQAYDLTGNREYAAAALARLRRQKTSIAPDRILCFYDFEVCDELPRLMKTVALAAAADPAGFWEYARQWGETHAPTPPPPPAAQPPETSLGVLSTDPLP